jgi:hypothetical protein
MFINSVAFLGLIDLTNQNIIVPAKYNEPDNSSLTQVLELTEGSEKIPFDMN